MKKLFTALVALSLMATSCEFLFEDSSNPKDEVNDGTNDGTNEGDTPEDVIGGSDIMLDNPDENYFFIDCRAQSIEIGFTADDYWLIECHEEWVTPSVTEGDKGHHTITLDIAENIEGEIRGTNVVIHNLGNGRGAAIIIEQAECAVFELSDDTIYIDSEGGYIDAYVATNMEYTVHIPEEASSWIEYYETRTVRNEIIVLSVAQNASTEERSAVIELRDMNNELRCSFTIIQTGEEVDFWTNIQKSHNVSSLGETVEIDVRTNLEYSVNIPAEATWITHTETRSSRWETIVLEIAQNDKDEERSATVEFCNTKGEVLASIVFTQNALSVITYTTTDGNIIDEPINWRVNVDVASNTYENGIGTMLFNGKLTTIDGEAFRSRTTLVSINLPNSITTIGQEAFLGCSALTSIVIPESVTTMGRDVFKVCTSLSDVTLNNTMTEIPQGMFYECSSLTHIDIPQCVTKIGEEAFCLCSNLVIEAIPESITEIGQRAFSNCTSITKLHISNNLQKVGWEAFYMCTNINEVHIDDLSAWCKIEFEGPYANPLYNGHFLYLNGNILSDLVIPSDVTEVKTGSFAGCLSIATVTIGDHVTRIGNSAFSSCEMLSVTIGDGVKEIADSAFFNCETLNTLHLGKSIESIGYAAFYDCRAITNVTLPAKLRSIGEEAFYGCRITSINIPSTVKSIGKSAFTSSINELHIGSLSAWCDIDFGSRMQYDSNNLKVYLNDNILEELEIPGNVTTIKPYAFYGWTNLTSITLPDSVTEIGEYAFAYCRDITSLDLGNGLQTIGEYAFDVCYVDDVTIPAGVKHIGDYAFSGTISKTLTFEGGVESIGKRAFESCGIETITLPYGTKSIDEYAFYYCFNMTTLELPSSVTYIGGGCFNACPKLGKLYCAATTPPTIGERYSSELFSSTAEGFTIYVPRGSLSSYQSAYVWRNHKDIITGYDF